MKYTILFLILCSLAIPAKMTITYDPAKGYMELHDPNTAPKLVIVIPLNENQTFALQQGAYKKNLINTITRTIHKIVERFRKQFAERWNLKDLKRE